MRSEALCQSLLQYQLHSNILNIFLINKLIDSEDKKKATKDLVVQ